ncbi:MAG: HIRAN domain-containing protein [Planctomycetes bacterium]|nr:HIRAN domain-containing protein [Planctomycetota bacterium]
MTWQEPLHAGYFPIARIVELGSRPRYEFGYIQGVRDALARGFHPFHGMASIDAVYRSHELHPMLANRLMPASRQEYARYVESLGLEPGAQPLEILARSGGTRLTDSFEVFSPPALDRVRQQWRYTFPVRGIRFVAAAEDAIRQLRSGDRLWCMLDLQNEHDPLAIALRTEDKAVVGYIPRYLNEDVRRLIEGEVRVSVALVNPAPFPVEVRLICELTADAVPDFAPFATERYQPISSDATRVEFEKVA